MPNFLRRKNVLYLVLALTLLCAFGIVLLAKQNFFIGAVAFVGFGLIVGILVSIDKSIRKQAESYITNLSNNLDETSKVVLAELPVGVILYNERYEVAWANKFMKVAFAEKVKMGESLEDISEKLTKIINKKVDSDTLEIGDRIFKVEHNKERKLIYFTDITTAKNIERTYHSVKPVIAIIFIDNYDDVTQGMDDQAKGVLQNLISSEISNWANDNEIFIKRNTSDKYVAVLNEKILKKIESEKFTIVDNVREITLKQGTMTTLSVGVGRNSGSFKELGKLAQSGVDLALGRGGDQVVIKTQGEKPRFFGGTTNPTGKRTRVRARVVSQALHDLIRTSQNVIIMGHKHPDVDVYGSGIGILRIAEFHNKKAYFVMDRNDIDISVSRLMQDVRNSEKFIDSFIYPDKALDIVTENTLLIVVDTNKPSMLIEERILKRTPRVVVIDHHRRGEDTIENPMLSYIEPYASSAAELITELIEYHPNMQKIESIDATALLAGIMVDTKTFTHRTGARTFDAASYLKSFGADLRLINKVLKENIKSLVERNKLIEQVYFYKDGFAITKGDEGVSVSRIMVAKAADALLSVEDINASFVIGCSNSSDVIISARSIGEINVQLIMEKMDGGGHLSNAATQLKDTTIAEAEIMLKNAVDEYIKERG